MDFLGVQNRAIACFASRPESTLMHLPEYPIYVGTAGWSIPAPQAERFPAEGSTLTRYAARFTAVEINSSFYKVHRLSTYARWAGETPHSFRFAVKLPKEITHTRKLADPAGPLRTFLEGLSPLGDRLGPLLVQLPPSLAYEPTLVRLFFANLRTLHNGDIVCEPRHESWFTEEADRVLVDNQVARVAADPARVTEAARPGGWPGIAYFRLHGFPRMYYSPYDDGTLNLIAARLREVSRSAPAWCIFDNTASGAACENALSLVRCLRE